MILLLPCEFQIPFFQIFNNIKVCQIAVFDHLLRVLLRRPASLKPLPLRVPVEVGVERKDAEAATLEAIDIGKLGKK